jgi:hypothetical protein
MGRKGFPRRFWYAFAVITTFVTACGQLVAPQGTDETTLEFTFADVRQFNTPVLVTGPDEPPLYRVTTDVSLVFRFADHLETLIVDLEGMTSGRGTHNEFDLTKLAPDITTATEGRWQVRVPLIIPELGGLQFSMVVVDSTGTRSGPVVGGFTVESQLGTGDTTQTQTSTTVSGS